MKVKKQLLIFVALMLLLMGAASATDVSNDTIGSDTPESIAEDTSAQEEVAMEETTTPTMDVEKNKAEQKINKITREEKTLKTASSYDVETYQELREVLTNINDEYITVNIKDNIKLDDSIHLKSNLNFGVRAYVTINGEGKTIDGDHRHFFLDIDQYMEVTINNLTVNNCTAAPSLYDGSQLTGGGAIINRDTLILNNTRFNNNRAELFAGAIWNYDTLIVDNSEFNNNTAHVDNLSANDVGLGGAIYGGSLIVNNTRFNNNTADYGGAIYTQYNIFTVDNTEFNNNHAYNFGGAINYPGFKNLNGDAGSIINQDGISSVMNSIFNNNTADRVGGAIDGGGILTVTNSQFNNNNAHGLYIEDELFGLMMIGGYGGAISNSRNLTVTDSEFNNNHADNFGGAIRGGETLTVTNTRFNNNSAYWWDGAIDCREGSYNVTDTTFYKNTPAKFFIDQDNYIKLEENGTYINVSNIAVIVDGKDIYNGPLYEIAAIPHPLAYCDVSDGNHLVKLIVNGTNITNNEYILSDTIDVTYQNLIDTIENATMDMTLKLEEGLPYNILETITLDKPGITITIDGNGQTINGMQNQVFHINSGSSLVLKNITITNAEAEDGGAIYNEGNLTIIDSTLINNQATSGGAIYNSYGNLTITDTTLNNNTAKDGGAIRTLYGSVTITSSTLNNNQATTTATGEFTYVDALGGAISNLYGSVTITDTTLNSNQATSTSTGNRNLGAHARGGAIYNTGTLTITDTTLNSNQATATASSTGEFRTVEAYAYGGAICNTRTLTITDCTLKNNQVMATATGFDAIVDVNALGGAIYNNKRNYNITGTSFYNNAPANIIINDEKRIDVIEEEDSFVSIGKFIIIADGKEIGTGTGIDNLTQFSIGDEYKNVEIVINGTDGKTLNNRYMLRGFSVEVHNYTELVEAMEKAQNDNYNSYIINLLPGYYNATKSITWEESETKNLIINANGLTLDGKGLYQFIKVGTELNLTLTNITLKNYKATNGGAIDNRGTLDITHSTLINNQASQGGALINYGNLTVTNSTFGNNDASNGAAIANFGNISVTENNFIANTGNEMGNVIESLDNAIIEDNINAETSRYGSTIYTDGENVRITGNTFYDVLSTSITISTNSSNPKVNDKVTLTLILKDQFDSPVCGENITIDQTTNVTTNPEGIASIEYTINSNETQITASYDGKEGEYSAVTGTSVILAQKLGTQLMVDNINSTVGDAFTITGTLEDENNNPLIQETVHIIVDNQMYTATSNEKGEFNTSVTISKSGKYNLTANYNGNDKYEISNTTQTVTINRKESKVTVNDITSVTCNDNVTITGKITDIEGNPLGHVNVFVYLNGEEQHVTTYRTGIFKATYITTTVGEQEVIVKYKGNTKYLASNATTTFTTSCIKLVMFTVKPVTYRDNYTIQGKLTDHEGNIITGAEVQLTINGETVTLTTDKKGRYTYKARALALGNFTVTATYNGEEPYNQVSVSKVLSVTKRATTLIIDEIQDTTVGTPTTISGKLTDDLGTAYKNCNIYVTINGEKQHIYTNTKGIFTCTYTPTSAGTQNVTVTYKGNTNYLGDKVTKSFTVN
ncbi:MAG: hypothetical protein E7Z85_08835 [Methanosphaera stadtmanae]|nr:hypothetical protein [Methanosphaera stadtmanae]